MPRKVLVGFGVDVDAVAGWHSPTYLDRDWNRLGSYGGEDSPLDISRGMFAGEVGVPRLLKLFKKYGIKTTWFIPGHSLETFPEQMAAVRDAGHELGLHGYSHEEPSAMTLEQQRDVLDYTHKLLTEFNYGIPPKGYVAPWWQTSKEGIAMLVEKGIEYDPCRDLDSCQAYCLRAGDTWTNIDYKAKAETWMKPLKKGKETSIVELPGNWYLEDMTPMMFIKAFPNSHGWVPPQTIEQLWKDMFTYFYREEKDFIFPISIHPDVSGRPQVLLMLERFIEWVNTHDHVQWATFYEMAKDFRERQDVRNSSPSKGTGKNRGKGQGSSLKHDLSSFLGSLGCAADPSLCEISYGDSHW
ncbi:glycoside hydrolase/deacetylase [Melanogaster broomeanus]|nr:glycoside hydrolase/deacetylase [Melanogaster broomeanus]